MMRAYTVCLLTILCLFFSLPAHALVNGQCGSADGGEYSTPGPSQKTALCNVGQASAVGTSGSDWAWTCTGSGGGSTDSCTASICGSVNGTCRTYASPTYPQPATDNPSACSTGSFEDMANTGTNWQWRCLGTGIPEGSNVNCTAPIAASVTGACRAYSGVHTSQPASNTASGCTSGTYADLTDSSSQFAWACNGVNGGASATCSATIDNSVGVCKVYTGKFYTQPASDNSTGCDEGVYADVTSGESSQWRWTCESTSGGPRNCAVDRNLAGKCRVHAGGHVNQPALDDATGCDFGTYVDLGGDTPNWRWTCQGEGTDPICTANRTFPTVNGLCGQANDGYFLTANDVVSAGQCDAGDPSTVVDSGTTFDWSCSGTGTVKGTDILCHADKAPPTFNGVCGSANGQTYSSIDDILPATQCNVGGASSISATESSFSWTCYGGGEPQGQDRFCSAVNNSSPPCPPAVNIAVRWQYFNGAGDDYQFSGPGGKMINNCPTGYTPTELRDDRDSSRSLSEDNYRGGDTAQLCLRSSNSNLTITSEWAKSTACPADKQDVGVYDTLEYDKAFNSPRSKYYQYKHDFNEEEEDPNVFRWCLGLAGSDKDNYDLVVRKAFSSNCLPGETFLFNAHDNEWSTNDEDGADNRSLCIQIKPKGASCETPPPTNPPSGGGGRGGRNPNVVER